MSQEKSTPKTFQALAKKVTADRPRKPLSATIGEQYPELIDLRGVLEATAFTGENQDA